MLPPARGVTLDTTLLASGPPGEETSAQIHYLIHSVGARVCVCVEKPLQSNKNQRLVLGNQRAYQGNHSRAGLSLKRITISCFLSESRQTLYQIPVSHQISCPRLL